MERLVEAPESNHARGSASSPMRGGFKCLAEKENEDT